MTSQRLKSIGEVVDAHLCAGCGACAYLAPDELRMVDEPGHGRRPLPIASVNGNAMGQSVDVCPGVALSHDKDVLADAPFGGSWGPVLALYECWSADPVVRYRGSSGGVVTALAAYAVESGRSVGALQVRARADAPLENETTLNRTREEITGAAGSRYSPASPCERLDLVEAAGGECVVVGKPCDIAATVNAGKIRPTLGSNVGLTIGIFCAGTPSTRGTEELLRRLEVEPDDVVRADYRGEGWPGRFRVRTRSDETRSLSYAESWDETLRKHRQWRCMICPDHTGEFADVSVGDPWYRPIEEDEPGRSLVVVRTEAGREVVQAALRDGVLHGHPIPLERLPQSQPNLATVRGAVWARVIMMRLAGLPAPRYQGMPSVRLWLRLSLRAKLATTFGTLRRIRRRKLRRPESSVHQSARRYEVRG